MEMYENKCQYELFPSHSKMSIVLHILQSHLIYNRSTE